MIHEHEATELASAAIDFPLSPELDRELRLSLRECPICAERAAAYHEQLRLLTRLPVVNASDATRRRVTAAAMTGRTERRSPMMLVLAAALLAAMLLGVAAAAGAFLSQQPIRQSLADPTPGPAASTVAVDGSPPASSVGPDGGGGGRQIFADTLEPDTIVAVVSGNLRVRSQPRVSDDSLLYEPLLQTGERLFVLEGPVVANEYDWYRVVLIGNGTDDVAWTELRSGWVARGDHDGAPWIAPDAPSCPDEPVDIADLTALHPLERLSCLGARPLSFDAVIEGGPQGGWVAESRVGESVDLPGIGLGVNVEPGEGVAAAELPDHRAVTLEGSFDQCGSFGGELPSLLGCRSSFVVTRATAYPTSVAQDMLAIVVSDNLRVRSLPVVSPESAKHNLLGKGTRLGIVDGPAVGSGYVWYRVAVPAIRDPAGGPLVGWVASAGKDGERWIDRDTFPCRPPDELTFAEFARLTSAPVFHGGRLCYGRTATSPPQTVAIEAHARLECSGGEPSAGSGWLMAGDWELVFEMGGTQARGFLRSGTAGLPCGGGMSDALYHASGHFDDEEAFACRAPGLGPRDPDPASEYECSNKFVVTELSVVGPGPTPVPIPLP